MERKPRNSLTFLIEQTIVNFFVFEAVAVAVVYLLQFARRKVIISAYF